jgi:protein SCO1/2
MRPFPWMKLLGLLVVLGLGATWGWRIHSSRPSDLLKEPIVLAPNFSFQDRSGRWVSRKDMEGKVWVTGFIFTRCAGICPMLSAEMKKLQEAWKGNDAFALVSFTVDPQRDTVASLKGYAASLGAEEARWSFLTGKKKDLYQVIRDGFLLTAEEDMEGGPGFEFIHTSRIVLVDAKGRVRGFYDSQQEADMKKLAQDVRYLMHKRDRS